MQYLVGEFLCRVPMVQLSFLPAAVIHVHPWAHGPGERGDLVGIVEALALIDYQNKQNIIVVMLFTRTLGYVGNRTSL